MKMYVYRVFCNEDDNYGNPVGVIFDVEGEMESQQRQQLATKLGYSECVFVNDLGTLSISIFSPQRELPFAGH